MGSIAEDMHSPVIMEFRVVKNRLNGDVDKFYLPYVPGWSYRDYLVRLGVDLVGAYVVEKGKRRGLNVVPSGPGVVFVCYDIGISAVAGAVKAFFALSWVKAIGTALMWAGLGYSVYTAFQKPKMPSFGTIGEGLDEGSPTYGWDGVATTQDVGLPVPIVYGEHKVGGNIINQYIWEDGEKSYLNVLLGLCEGEIESISDIKINGNPIDNFSGVEVYTRLGTNDQEVIPAFGDVHHNNSLNVQLTKNNSYTYTTSRSDVEAFELHFRLPNGLFQQDNSGAIKSWDVYYRVEYKEHSATDWIDLGVQRISGKSRSVVRRVFRKEGLSAGQYDIRITRTSDDSDFYHIGDLYLVNVDEITTEDLAYPNTALLGLRMLASEQLSGSMPTITCVVRGRKVRAPIIKDDLGNEVAWEDYYWDSEAGSWKRFSDGAVLSWDGTSWGERWCANPIWCLRDLLTNERYGLGRYIDDSVIDDEFLMEMAKFCDEGVDDGNGGLEKRFRLDVVIDSFTKALDLIVQLCATFRGMPLYSEGGIKLLIDKKDNPVQVFGMGNVVADSFNESWRSKNETPNWVEVVFSNKDKDYEQDVVCVVDEEAVANGEPIRKKQIRMYSTRVSQAVRLGKYMLEVGRRIDRTISFKTSVEGVSLQPGDVFLFSHDVPRWGESGRVVGGSLSSVVLDKKVVIEEGKSYRVIVRFSDDTIEERDVTNSAGETDVLTVSPDFSQVPSRYDVWVFGEVGKVSKPFRCVSLSRTGEGEVEITGIEYDEGVYGDEGVVIPEDKYSSLEAGLPNVSDVVLKERVITQADGTVESAIEVYFRKPELSNYPARLFKGVRIYLSDNEGASWEERGYTEGDGFTIIGGLVVGTSYRVAVVSVGKDGSERKIENSPYADITLTGKEVGPSQVSGFSYDFSRELVLWWDKNSEPDIAGYEIRKADNGWGVDNADLIYRGLVNKFVYRPESRNPGTLYIRAFNTSGVYSSVSSSVTPQNTPPPAPTISVFSYFSQAKVSWDDAVDADLEYYEVWGSATNDWSGEEVLLAKVKGKSAIVKIDNDPTYIRVRAVDSYGPGGWSNTAIANKVGVVGEDIEDGAITETKIADGSITAPKLYTGEVITLSAQIKSGIIEDAHILNLSAEKIQGGTISGEEIVLAEGGQFRSADYDEEQKKGFKIDGEEGIKLYKGSVDADVTLIEGASLRQQFEVTPSATIHDTVSEFDDSNATKTNVVVEGEETEPAVILIDGQTSGEYISAPIPINNADLGTIQWETIKPSNTDLAYTYGTADAYWEKGASRDDSEVSGDGYAIDGNDGTRVNYGDGTHKWGWNACCQVDLGTARYVNKFRIKCGASKSWKLQCSDDGATWEDVTGWINSLDYTATISRRKKRYWRWFGDTCEEYYDWWTIYSFELYYAGDSDVKVYTRTASSSDMSDATSWEPSGDGYSNPAGSSIVSPTNAYLQYRLVFSVSSGGSAYVRKVRVNYDGLKIKTSLIKIDDVTIKINGSGQLYSHLSDGSISQAKLKTATGSGHFTCPDTAWITLPGGEYGFYPLTATVSNSGHCLITIAQIWWTDTTYRPRLGGYRYGTQSGNVVIYWKQRYVTASGYYHWIYLLLDKENRIKGVWVAPDHPSANIPALPDEIPYPFSLNEGDKVIVVDESVMDEVKELVRANKGRKTPAEILTEEFILDDWERPKFKPVPIIKIDEWDAYEGRHIAEIKVPQWCRVMFNNDKVCLKEIVVDRLPSGIEFRKMRRKGK